MTAPAVDEAAAELGQPAARPVLVLVWPLTTTVEVVNWTWGTVTVVTSGVVMLLEGIVQPEETPVL